MGKTCCTKPSQKRYRDLSRDEKITAIRGVLAISLALTIVWEQTQEIQLCSPDYFSLGGTHGRAGHVTSFYSTQITKTVKHK